MNCPQCDSLMYYDQCRCGWIRPPISTVQIKQMGMQESKDPVYMTERAKEIIKTAPPSGKAKAEYCLNAMRDILNGKV